MPKQKQQLLSMRAAGKRWIEIASVLGKTGTQVQAMHIKLVKNGYPSDEDGWPMPVKPEKKQATAVEVAPAAQQPKMKFRKQTVRNTWGHEQEIDVPVPTGKYKDPETGAKVTKYPPGYAIGTHPPRNVTVKGGA